MEKKTYYITVASGEMLENSDNMNYDFEIKATVEDIAKLQDLFEEKEDATTSTYLRSHIPYLEYHNDESNDAHDYYLTEIYRMLHSLGTEETKQHIEKMNILHG